MNVHDLQKSIKQLNERVAKVDRKFGQDSLLYKRIVSSLERYVKGSPLKSLIKTTSSGNFALEQAITILKTVMSEYTGLEVEKMINLIPTISEHKRSIEYEIELEHKAKTSFEDDLLQTKDYKEFKEKKYTQVREAVRKWLDDNPFAVSPIINAMDDEVKGRRPTYWEMYKGIANHIGADWRDITATTEEMAGPTTTQARPDWQEDAAALAAEEKEKMEAGAYGIPDIFDKPAKPGKGQGRKPNKPGAVFKDASRAIRAIRKITK